MRIPNTAEIFTFFAAIGQFSNLRSADWELSLAPADVDIADSEFRVSDVIPAGADDADLAPACSRAYTVKPGDNCLSIAEKNGAPTYQIICQNDQINGKCSNLGTSIGQDICLGLQGEDCKETIVVTGPNKYRHPQAIAKQFKIPYELFMDNNYCYYVGPNNWVCPTFQSGTVVCIAQKPVRVPGKCAKIF